MNTFLYTDDKRRLSEMAMATTQEEKNARVAVADALHRDMKVIAALEDRLVNTVYDDAVRQYLKIRRGELQIIPATPQEDTRE
jgi:predicted transcriptional regulator